MNVVEILDVISDAYIVFFWSLFLLYMVIMFVYELVTGKLFNKEETEEDPLMKKIDKLQETVDCLASEHIDAEAMKDLQEPKSNPRISHNLALGYVETLEGAFGVDPEYYDQKYSGAIQGLKFYIVQNAKDDASQ